MEYYDAVIIGAGISGLSAAIYMKQAGLSVLILEKADSIGGLIRCNRVEGSLYHLVGGHVFNSKIDRINDFFWAVLNKCDFTRARRRAKIDILNSLVDYPIESSLYQLPKEIAQAVINDLLLLGSSSNHLSSEASFEEFLLGVFGETLYRLYFLPYNAKIWKKHPRDIPVAWLDGKLPMPTVSETIMSNIFRQNERGMVHSEFFYPLSGGSQHIAEGLSAGLDVRLNAPCESIELHGANCFFVNGAFKAKKVLYTGDVRVLPEMIINKEIQPQLVSYLHSLASNGTSNLLCKTTPLHASWIYLPSETTFFNRIICTGNFSPSNTSGLLTSQGFSTCVVEATGDYSFEAMENELGKLPYELSIISHNHAKSTYVIQDSMTRTNIKRLKSILAPFGLFLSGRFAEWEYYNMDTAINAAISASEEIVASLKRGE